MRTLEPFGRRDLDELDERLLSRAEEVVAMREVAAGEHDPLVIGLRHDVDNILTPCAELAAWEAERGYRATYFILHDSPYWESPALRGVLEEVASYGHEIGLHANALAEGLRQNREPAELLEAALERLRAWGHRVTGVAAHGDPLCHSAHFVNDEMFLECVRPEYGDPDRYLEALGTTLRIEPRPLADFGLEYDSYRAGTRALYLSDSGGRWNEPFSGIVERFPTIDGQLHVLIHPCWWVSAFAGREVTA